MSHPNRIALALNALDDDELIELVGVLHDTSARNETVTRLYEGARQALTARQDAAAERERCDTCGLDNPGPEHRAHEPMLCSDRNAR